MKFVYTIVSKNNNTQFKVGNIYLKKETAEAKFNEVLKAKNLTADIADFFVHKYLVEDYYPSTTNVYIAIDNGQEHHASRIVAISSSLQNYDKKVASLATKSRLTTITRTLVQ